MGAWGVGSFDNDDAVDWLEGFGADGAATLQQALEAVADLDPQDYLEAPEAVHALAAAEIVAAARYGDMSRLPSEAAPRVEEHAGEINAAKLISGGASCRDPRPEELRIEGVVGGRRGSRGMGRRRA